MTQQQALDLLNQVSAEVTGNRKLHEKINEAVSVLQDGINTLANNRSIGDDEKWLAT